MTPSWQELTVAWAAAEVAEPFGRWSDLECTVHDCYDEALLITGRRASVCELHRQDLVPFANAVHHDLLTRGLVIDYRDLTLQQRTWAPTDTSMTEWPHADRVEIWDGVFMFENRWQLPWSWRSVAMAARAYPNRRVRLVHNMLQVPALD